MDSQRRGQVHRYIKGVEFREEAQEGDVSLNNTNKVFICPVNEPSHCYVAGVQNPASHVLSDHLQGE